MSPEAFVHYKVGVENIDDEHWEILIVLNDINSSCRENNYRGVVNKICQLKRLLQAHYASEEEMMERIKFPYLKYHRDAHLNILLELSNFYPLCVKKNMLMLEFSTAYLYKLTVGHLDTLDRQYMEYYAKWKEASAVTQ
jgi:hemerythrin-like metal-binding protein